MWEPQRGRGGALIFSLRSSRAPFSTPWRWPYDPAVKIIWQLLWPLPVCTHTHTPRDFYLKQPLSNFLLLPFSYSQGLERQPKEPWHVGLNLCYYFHGIFQRAKHYQWQDSVLSAPDYTNSLSDICSTCNNYRNYHNTHLRAKHTYSRHDNHHGPVLSQTTARFGFIHLCIC